jgi:hypothetical protein
MNMIKKIPSMLLLLLILVATSYIAAEENPPLSRLRRGDDSIIIGHTDDDPHPVCGRPTDSCMNSENWEQCRFLVEEYGCEKIVAEESCPLQFVCMNNLPSVDDVLLLHGSSEVNATVAKRQKKGRGCVSLLVYKDQYCKIGPVRKLEFETVTHPGSSCCTSKTALVFNRVECSPRLIH